MPDVDNSFPKKLRLLNRSDFNGLRVDARRARAPYLHAYYINSKIKDHQNTRFGFSVSKKVGNAVVRNRVKRLMRETFRKSNYKQLSADILFVVNANLFKKTKSISDGETILLSSFSEIMKEIADANNR